MMRSWRRVSPTLNPVLGFVLLVAAWQFCAPLAGIPSYVLPLPSTILARFGETFAVQMQDLSMTALTTLVGLALALVTGVLLALLVIYFPMLRAIAMPLLAAFNSIPKIAVAPLFVIWFGLGLEFEDHPGLPARLVSDLREFADGPRRDRAGSPRSFDARGRHKLAHFCESAAHERRALHH